MSASPGAVIAGASPVPDISPDRLTPQELAELQQLMGARELLHAQLQALEQRLELLVLGARDRRGLSGRVSVHPETGMIAPVPPPE